MKKGYIETLERFKKEYIKDNNKLKEIKDNNEEIKNIERKNIKRSRLLKKKCYINI